MHTFFLATIFLFISSTLFSAHESQLLIKSASPRHISSEEMKYTVELKKLVNKVDSARDTRAAWHENSPAMIEWIKMGANVNIKIPSIVDNYLLHEASYYDEFELVKACLANGALIERTNRFEETVLFYCKSIRLLELFSKLGVNFGHISGGEYTVLHKAIDSHCSTEVIEFLSQYIKSSSNYFGQTPLHKLCFFRTEDFGPKVAMLLWANHSLAASDAGGESPADYLQKWHPDYVPTLNKIGKEVKQAQAEPQFSEWQSKKMNQIVGKFLPNLVGIVRSYSGPPLSQVSLRYFMQDEESKRRYPEIMQALFNYIEPSELVEPAQLVGPAKSIELVGPGMFGEIAKPIKFVEDKNAESVKLKEERLEIELVSRPEQTPCCPIC